MTLTCPRCDAAFDHPTFRGYCAACLDFFHASRERVAETKARRAAELGADHVTGQFRPEDTCPSTVYDPVRQANVCGLCGSDHVEPGYGFAGGYGLGMYNFCGECGTVLDFSPDNE